MTTTEIEALPAGRELDAQIEVQVFGRCPHDMQYVSTEELKSRARREIMREWEVHYGKQPPDQFIMAEAESRVWAETEGDYSPKECTKCHVTAYGTARTPYYSTDIAAAWEVVEKMGELGLTGGIQNLVGAYFVTFMNAHGAVRFTAKEDTAPLAICRAALKAVAA